MTPSLSRPGRPSHCACRSSEEGEERGWGGGGGNRREGGEEEGENRREGGEEEERIGKMERKETIGERVENKSRI